MPSRRAIDAIRSEPLVAGAAAGATIGFVAYGFAIGADLAPLYAITVGLLFWLVAAIHARTPLSRLALWCLLAWGVAHLAAGIVPLEGERILYNGRFEFPPFQVDRLIHAFGFGTTTLVSWEVLKQRFPSIEMTKTTAVIVWLAGLGVGAINEAFEFLATRIADTNVGGFENTGWDLIANLTGCTLVALTLFLRHHPRHP